MTLDVLIRQATSDDIPELLRHRRGMYEDMGYNDPEALLAMVSTCKPYLQRRWQTVRSTAGWRTLEKKPSPAEWFW